MRKIIPLTMLGAAFALMLPVGSAQAQATRTWVSGVGDDVNPCSRTAPCKTYAGAISKTAANGEISTLDPGGFGAVTITKSITISGDGTLAGILSAGATQAVLVNGLNIKVVLRNLSIQGAGTGIHGVRFLQGAELTIDNCTIGGLTTNGIEVALTAAGGRLYVRDTRITGVARGIRMTTTVGTVNGSMKNVSINGATTAAVETNANALLSVDASQFTGSAVAIFANGAGSKLGVSNSDITSNTVGLSAGVGIVRMSSNNVFDNVTQLFVGGGQFLLSDNNNRVDPPSAVVPTLIQLK